MQVEDRHDADLSLILPTRGRHSMLKRFFASLIQTASRLSRLEVIMYMDDDDQQCPVADATHLQTHTVIGPRQTMGTMIRTCAAQARGRAFMLINDDAVFRTSGWDAAIADVRAGHGGAVPAHLRGTGYAGAARLGHGEGYRYSHDEPNAVGPQQYLPDDLVDAEYYQPTDRGWEERLGPRWRELRAIIRGTRSGR